MPAADPRIASRADFADRADPIDILAAEHGILRSACARLERLATEPHPDPDAARSIAAQLRAILPRHMADENECLFPLLRDRAEPEDEIELVLARLAIEHEDGGARALELLVLLDRLGEDARTPSSAERATIGAYAAGKLRHLSLETAIVLPIARERLSEADRARLRDTLSNRNLHGAVTA
jgi:hemerythrin-like domain-containing protein